MTEAKEEIVEENQLNFFEFLSALWREKLIVCAITIAGAVYGFYHVNQKMTDRYVSKAIFGFQDKSNSELSIMDDLSMLGNFSNKKNDNNNNLLTQINGKDFLREVVLELKLNKDSEFYSVIKQPTFWSVQGIKNKLKEVLGQKPILGFTDKEIIELVIDKLRSQNLSIGEVNTGGYSVSVTTQNPLKSAMIANTITYKFLDARLQSKINKSDKTLDYLSKKLGEAQLEMDKAGRNVEMFALERNVLSKQEFAAQSRRLREFRNRISELKENLISLQQWSDLENSKNIDVNNLKYKLDDLYDIAPRLKLRPSIVREPGERDFKSEIENIKLKINIEISRLKETLIFTQSSLTDLEDQARSTAIDAREIETLKRIFAIKTAAYDALIKQFESQSIVDGYQEALGEVYETAKPSISPIGYSKITLLVFFSAIGLFIGVVLALLRAIISGKLWFLTELESIINLDKQFAISSHSYKFQNLFKIIATKYINKKAGRDLILIKGISSIIERLIINKKGKCLFITCAGFGNKNSSIIGFYLAYILSNKGIKVSLIDLSSDCIKTQKKLEKVFNKKPQGNRNFLLNEYVFYTPIGKTKSNSSIVTYLSEIEKEKSIQSKTCQVVMTVVNQLEKEITSMDSIISAEKSILLAHAGDTSKKDLQAIKSSMGKRMHECLAFILRKK